MAFNDTKSEGDLVDENDWNDFVDFAESISSNRGWSTISGAQDLSNWNSANWTNSSIIWNGTSWVALASGGTSSDVAWSSATDFYGHSSNTNIHHQYASTMSLGLPGDGSFAGGTLSWTADTKVTTALDDVNEILSELAPSEGPAMQGTLTDNVTNYTGRVVSRDDTTKGSYSPKDLVSNLVIIGDFDLDAGSIDITFNKADEGTLNCYINGTQSGSLNLGNIFDEGERDGSQSWTPSTNKFITVNAIGKYNNFQKWQQGSGQVTTIDVSENLLHGYNWIYISHEGITAPASTSNYVCWYDNRAEGNASIDGKIRFATGSTFNDSKKLSGIHYFDTGDTFRLWASGLNCFTSLYRNGAQMRYANFNGISNANIDWEDANVIGISDPPVSGETIIASGIILTISNTARSKSDTIDVWACDILSTSRDKTSATVNYMIDTYGTTSTVTDEYFDDENYRLPSGAYDSVPGSITGVWDSTVELGNCSAQVHLGILDYPDTNYSTYYPAVNQSIDYSSFSGPQLYFRVFFDDGTPHTNGQLQLGGLSDSDVDPVGTGDVNVEIKLPGLTGWLDLGTDYDSGSFSGSDGDGCQTAQSGDDWSWTSGTNSTADSGYMIVVKVTIRNSSKSLTDIRELGW